MCTISFSADVDVLTMALGIAGGFMLAALLISLIAECKNWLLTPSKYILLCFAKLFYHNTCSNVTESAIEDLTDAQCDWAFTVQCLCGFSSYINVLGRLTLG